MNEIEVAQLISPFIYYYEQLLFSNDKQVRYTANQRISHTRAMTI